MQTVAELFCASHHVSPEKFVRSVFWHCLYRRALPLAPLIFFFDGEYFAPDFDLIAGVGRSTTASDLHSELVDFCTDSRNHSLLRSWLKIRVSGARLRHLVHQTRATETRVPAH